MRPTTSLCLLLLACAGDKSSSNDDSGAAATDDSAASADDSGAPDSPSDDSGDDSDAIAADDSGDSGDSDDTGDTGGPCTAATAVFFDLGETLVTERSDHLFEELPGARDLLDALRAQGTPIGLISNTGRGWTLDDLRDLLVDPSLIDLFDVVLISSEAESRPKPDPAIYAEGVALLDPTPDIATTVYVSADIDDLADDDPPTEGAQAAGMVGVLITDRESPLADHTLPPADLPELVDEAWMSCLEVGD